ncbi:hypothetical protein [Shinella kummerowiae]|uniref:hypothetical protein n=1 Tax=Shinella kummerowiae TaxID=417745 RepID=UPI0021B5BECC|nr:hypothetical protein [Shinella kummerowiae]
MAAIGKQGGDRGTGITVVPCQRLVNRIAILNWFLVSGVRAHVADLLCVHSRQAVQIVFDGGRIAGGRSYYVPCVALVKRRPTSSDFFAVQMSEESRKEVG